MSDAVLYARFSPGARSDCDSAEAQLDSCRTYAQFHKMEVIGEFKDEWLSGKNDDRLGFQDAIALTCKSKATMVVYSLSRFARCTADALTYSEAIGKAKANLASIKENLDTNTSVGRFFFTVMAAIAELNREQIGERTSEAMLFYQSQGRIMGKRIPYGFQRDPDNPKMMIPCGEEVEVMDLMQSYRNQGLSYRSIARRLWCDGVLGRRDCVFRMEKAPHGSGNKKRQTEEVIAHRVGMFNAKTIETILKRASQSL